MSNHFHTPVLRDEVLGFLITDDAGVYVDGTLGGGGHAAGICERLGREGRLVCFDADDDALRFASERLKSIAHKVTFVHSNFRKIKTQLHALGIDAINGLLLDLGVSTFQLDEEEKGFSFRYNARIDMRMDRTQTLSGWDVVNRYDDAKLADVLWKYGEERNARRIARAIVAARPVDTTGQLAMTIEKCVGKRFLVKTLARVFQALRIEVNDELRSLEHVLTDSVGLLKTGGRIVVIAYHSLEDRIVKNFFKESSRERIPSGHKYVPDTPVTPKLRILTRSPLEPSREEIERNPRARSAKMRVAEKIAA